MKKRIKFNVEDWERCNGKLITKNGIDVHLIYSNIKMGDTKYISGYVLSPVDTILPFLWDYKGQSTVTYKDNIYDLYIEIEEEFVFEPFQKVLVRDSKDELWRCSIYSHRDEKGHCCAGGYWKYLLPYNEETRRLLGTNQNI